MIEQDTVKLLRERDAGVKMGVASIDDVLPHVQAEDMKQLLQTCKREHEQLASQIETALAKYQDEGKEPNPIAQGRSWMTTNVKLGLNESDATTIFLNISFYSFNLNCFKRFNRYISDSLSAYL